MGRLARAGAVLALTLGLATSAYAHGGGTILTGSNDAYKLSVQALDVRLPDGRPAVDFTAYPIRRVNGAPDLNAEVVFTIGETKYTGERAGDGIAVEIPQKKTGAWRREPISVTLNGAAGTLTASAEAQISSSGPPGWLVPVTIVLVLALIAITIVRRRRSAPEPVES